MVFRQTIGGVGVGSKAPDFKLPSQSGEMVSLKGWCALPAGNIYNT
jgi:hypothetical protein